MTAIAVIRRCPRCGSERPAVELACENEIGGVQCRWSLVDVPLQAPGQAPAPLAEPRAGRLCARGHPLGDGEELCVECGAMAASPSSADSGETPAPAGNVSCAIPGWRIVESLPCVPALADRFVVEAEDTTPGRGVLWLYEARVEPDPSIYPVVQRLPRAHVPALLAFGRADDRAWEVWEQIEGQHLGELPLTGSGSADSLRPLVSELGLALASLAEAGLRHRDLRPENLLVRAVEPVELALTGFGSARLSELDLDVAPPLKITRYSAPETVVGTVSAASDWWSAGVVLLERVTAGRCFEHVSERAFLLHVVTRGLAVPDGLDPAVSTLLRGLLARDPSRRWQWAEVRRWLDGEAVEAPADTAADPGRADAPTMMLGGVAYRSPAFLALAAAEAQNWEAAVDLLSRGALATWLENAGADARAVSAVRAIASDETLDADARLALALMAINPNLPLSLRGDIVTPGWLLAHPAEGYALLAGPVVDHLRRMGREPWLVEMRARADAVRARVASLQIELDEERLRVMLLCASRSALEAEWARIRRLFPDTDHAGLASLLERRARTDEDLAILASAAVSAFTPAAAVLDAATDVAAGAGVPAFDRETARIWLARSRREIHEEIDRRLQGFARCGMAAVDAWADSYRLERRMDLARALVLLAVPADEWKTPPRQEYVSQLLGFFERRVAASVQQGPLVRLTVARTSARLDLTELGSPHRPAQAILDRLLERSEAAIEIDPAVFAAEPARESRLRRLVSHATTFRRDTGMNGLYLGFPFLVFRDTRNGSSRTPRVAPVLLWPVRVDAATGARNRVTVVFDREREEVRLNPALEGLFGADKTLGWREAANDVLGRAAVRVADVMDVFGVLAEPVSRALSPLPPRDATVPPGQERLHCAAVLFHSDFSGQGVAEDLRAMASRPIAGTALEAALRLTDGGARPSALETIPEADRYVVVDSDPSQDRALAAARRAPGLLVEGPPGTGKSQTIVNIIADAIGRQETILVVCQKQAALRVVEKRLQAERLGGRLFVVTDVNGDRMQVLRELRAQIDGLRRDGSRRTAIELERDAVATRIEAMERALNRQHAALQTVGERSGVSYRSLIGELIALEAGNPAVSAPALRAVLGPLGRADVTAIADDCVSVAALWLAARYEDSPLAAVKPFGTDDAMLETFRYRFHRFAEAERERDAVLRAGDAFELDDPSPYRAWIETHGPTFKFMPLAVRRNLAAWLDQFLPGAAGPPPGLRIITMLKDLERSVAAVVRGRDDRVFFDALASLAPAVFETWRAAAERAAAPVSVLGRLHPFRLLARRRVAAHLRALGHCDDEASIGAFRDAARVEVARREAFRVLEDCGHALGADSSTLSREPLSRLIQVTADLLADLRPVATAAAAIAAYPRRADAEAFARAGTAEAFEAFLRQLEGGFARHAARRKSLGALDALADWFADDFTAACRARVESGSSNEEVLMRIADALPAVAPYQRFRIRVAELGPKARQTLAVLRASEAALAALLSDRIGHEVGRTIAREARLAWKARIEAAEPALLVEPDEIDTRVRALAAEDKRMRDLNQRLLAEDPADVAPDAAWENITRLRGPRARRLREVVERGVDLGLTRLRPVWLTNPDAASRLLPLREGLFDVVVFDEASQLPVELALPALYRARRVVVSGDDKQMPPTSFFVARIDTDEDSLADEDDIAEGLSDEERAELEETWNRREIKDCPDLLALARAVLPSSTLQVHYRSKYRELIAFSNAAFYGGRLAVPARHPDGEVRRVKPIEVVKAGTPYVEQTNPGEAKLVADFLADLWRGRPFEDRPSIGVVTFNRRQAELIDDILEARAEDDAEFSGALGQEMARTQHGEDMGFFVKNLENVQGDERDVIVFSTTFGPDATGRFRRAFGALGQRGGERRLNVAITRARERVVLVTSLPIHDISDFAATERMPRSPRDYLQAYMDYAGKLSNGSLDLARALTRRLAGEPACTDRLPSHEPDGFVADVEAFIRGLGYDPVPGADSGAFSVDFTIEDPRTGLFGIGIECDGPRDELLANARAREIWRPAVLGKAIPRLCRVRCRQWYENRSTEQGRLADAIAQALGRRGGA